MSKPALVVMAAGMGSRYGGLKQIDPIDKEGHLIIDFSIYDALKAGFEKIVFVIKHEIEKDFKASIGDRISEIVKVEYVYQELDKLPQGYSVPQGRVKPWGTAHAILCCENVIDGPFAVINSDDYYGPQSYKELYSHLMRTDKDDRFGIALVGYILRNTLTDKGYVSRGICRVENGKLLEINERTHIETDGNDARFTEDDGKTYTPLSGDSIASMNMWGYNREFIDELKKRFPKFLDKTIRENPLKGEFFLPVTVDDMLRDGVASVDVLTTHDKWYGVTYAEDKPAVTAGIQSLKDKGVYPEKLWK
ncbi:MAG: nucleotidyltransferase [Clostridia bacterium]|nr:nucleotidyltransferase [Clostridia bacterium]